MKEQNYKKNLFILWAILTVYIGVTQYFAREAKIDFSQAVEKIQTTHEKFYAKQFELLTKIHKKLDSGESEEGKVLLEDTINIYLPIAKEYYEDTENKECEKALCDSIKYAEGLK